MTEQELVEKVARAICEEDHKGGDFGMMGIDAWEEPRGREVYIARARAALSVIREALSEPTPAMLGAAWNADELHCPRTLEGESDAKRHEQELSWGDVMWAWVKKGYPREEAAHRAEMGQSDDTHK